MPLSQVVPPSFETCNLMLVLAGMYPTNAETVISVICLDKEVVVLVTMDEELETVRCS